MRSHLPDGSAVIIDASFGSLDDFETEAAPPTLLDIGTAALPSNGPAASRLRGKATDAPRVVFPRSEFDGIVIASLLSIAAIGYGGFHTVTSREPIDARLVPARPSTAYAHAPAAAPVVDAVPPVPVALGTAAPAVPAPVVVPRRADPLTARTLTALWKQHDTRSLEQAFTGLRRQTLALHRCGMRVIANDRAVARCDGAGAAWTIDFQRSAGRWRIAGVTRR